MPTKNDPKFALFVIGMHRSGTSALTEAVSHLGFGVPLTLLPPSQFNKKGYWESDKINQLNDKILSQQNLTWLDWKSFDIASLSKEDRSTLVSEISGTVTDEFEGAHSVVIKDPRICRLAPLYFEALDALGYTSVSTIVYRNPLEVMSSLDRRQSLGKVSSGLLWLQYNLDAEFLTRGSARVFVSNEKLVSEKSTYLSERLGHLGESALTGFSSAALQAVDDTFDDSLKNESASSQDAEGDVFVGNLIVQTYQLLKKLEDNANDARVESELDAIRSAVATALPLIEGTVKQTRLDHEASAAQNEARHLADITAKDARIQILESDLRKAQTSLEETTANLQHTQTDCQKAQTDCLQAETDLKETATTLLHVQDEMQKVQSEKAGLQDHLQSIQVELETQIETFNSLTSAKADSDRHIENITAILNNQKTEMSDLETRLSQHEVAAKKKTAKLKVKIERATNEVGHFKSAFEEKLITIGLMEKVLEEQRAAYDRGTETLKATLDEKTNAIEQHLSALAVKSEVESRLNTTVETLSQTLNDTNERLENNRQDYEGLLEEREALRRLTTELSDQIERRDAFLNDLSETSIWKFSKLLGRRDSILSSRPDIFQLKLPDLTR